MSLTFEISILYISRLFSSGLPVLPPYALTILAQDGLLTT